MVRYKLVYNFKGQVYNCVDRLVQPAVPRLIAIGDIHGDMQLMLDCLMIALVIQEVPSPSSDTVQLVYKDGKPRYYKWTGDKTVVVQVGDQVDRCRPYTNESGLLADCEHFETTYQDEASDEKILIFMSDLDRLARTKGGAVYSLLGNHELINIQGKMNYVSFLGLKEYSKDDVNPKDRIEYFKRGSDISKFIACTRPTLMIIGSYMFVHGGFLSTILKRFKNQDRLTILNTMNAIYNLWILNEDNKLNEVLKEYTPYERARLINTVQSTLTSPLWVRGPGSITPNLPKDHTQCDRYKEITDVFAIKGMVIGHTPQLRTGINSTCGDSIIRVDVASSRAFHKVIEQTYSHHDIDEIQLSRQAQVLEIINDKELYVLTKDSKKKING
jgi:hypothetical protein